MEPQFQGPNSRFENDLRDGPARARLRLLEDSIKPSSEFSSLGQDFRNARQRRGLELSQISSSLKISKRHLNAIEESDTKALPLGDVYLIGYTRTYANYLGLNSGQCVEKMKSEIAERAAKGQVPMAQKHKSPRFIWHALRFLGLGSYDL